MAKVAAQIVFKIITTVTVISVLTYAPLGAAAAPALVSEGLQNLTIFSQTYTTTGANSLVSGNVLSGDVSSTGANASVAGNLVSVGAVTIGGAGSKVSGNILSGGVLTTGDGSVVGGNITSSGASTVGANSKIGGNMVSGGAATTGASSTVTGNIQSGGAASVGAVSTIGGTVAAVGAISIAAGSTVGLQSTLSSSPIDATATTAAINATVTADALQVSAAQIALSAMGAGHVLAATITTNLTLDSGVYSAASLSTAAGTTLFLDGQNLSNQYWVFNIADILATGVSTNIELINAGLNSSVIWNIGGYASLGASSRFLGTTLADLYISVGANTDVAGVGNSCGSLYSATSYVSTGDAATIGGIDCISTDSGFVVDQAGTAQYSLAPLIDNQTSAPEPASWALLITGVFLTGLLKRSRARVGNVAA
jgi:hypothetical protein